MSDERPVAGVLPLPVATSPTSRVYYLPTAKTMKNATLHEMARQVRDHMGDERIRTRVRQIMAAARVRSGDYMGEVRALWNFILAHVRYMRDPVGIEHITGPVELDRQVDEGVAAEDCESMAVYAATLFAAMGHLCDFEIYAMNPEAPDDFTHVALAVLPPSSKRWMVFDPVGASHREGFDLGDTVWSSGMGIERWTLEGKKRDTPVIDILDASGGNNQMAGARNQPPARRYSLMENVYQLGFGDVNAAQLAAAIAGAVGGAVQGAANIYTAATTPAGAYGSGLSPAQQLALQEQQQQALLPWYRQDKYALPLYVGGGLLLLKVLKVL